MAQGDDVEQLSIHCGIDNHTDEDMRLRDCDLGWGVWTQGPADVPAGRDVRVAFGAAGRGGGDAGVEGHVLYWLGDDLYSTVRVYWDLPSRGSPRLRVEPSADDVCVTVEGWKEGGGAQSIVLTIHSHSPDA